MYRALTSGKWKSCLILRAWSCLCGEPTQPEWLMAILAGWVHISSCRKSGLRKPPPQTTGKQLEAITFVLRFLITPTFHHRAEMGHGCQRHIKHLEDIWVSRTSDGPFLTTLSTRLPTPPPRFQSRQWFSAEELKSFFHLSTFLLIDDDWSCLTSCLGRLFPFYCCACLSKNKRFQIECVSDTSHYLLCSKVIHLL